MGSVEIFKQFKSRCEHINIQYGFYVLGVTILSSYVQIIVEQPLDRVQFKQWFECVKQHVPEGMIVATQIPHVDQNKMSTYYTRQTANHKHAYVVPLARDLDSSEVHAILKSWCTTYPEGDFTFDYSQAVQQIKREPDLLQARRWDQILDAWGKQQHQHWLQRHADDGWRYGATLSLKDRTHPWMQPWESLPLKARELNLKGVQDLIQILDEFGYQITQKTKS